MTCPLTAQPALLSRATRGTSILFFCSLLLALPSPAQVVTGTPPFGSFAGGPDVVDLGNNNVHLAIPVLHKPGRGQNFIMDITYDSSVWLPVGASGSQFWSSVNNWGWQGIYNNSMGYLTYQTYQQGAPCDPPNDMRWNSWSTYTNWTFVDQAGTAHTFAGATFSSTSLSGCVNPGTLPPGFTSAASDGSGYVLSASGTSGTVYTNDGKTMNLPINPAGPPQSWSVADRNGNVISGSAAGVYTDTLGYNVLTQNLVYTAPAGSAQFVGKYSTLTVQTAFGCSGISEVGPSGTSLLTEIDLPDYNSTTNPNARYTFAYEVTPGDAHNPHYVTGRLASVTLPTGGTISYSYSGGSQGIVCADGSTATLTRTTPDGTWIYARSQISGNHWQTTITDPANNQTVIDFQKDSNTNSPTYIFYETNRQVYQGSVSPSNLMQTTYACFNGASSPCTTTAVSSPITQKSVTTILPGANNLQSKVTAFYNSNGLPTETDEYDFGSGAPPSTPLRKTLTTYASLGNNISNMPASVVVQDGSGNVKAKTTYAYDEGSVVATSGTPQHGSVTGSRGNLTTLKTYTGTSSYLTSTMTYFDTGNVQTVTDVNNGVTTYTYSSASASCGNSFPTGITEAISTLTQAMTWNCTGGVQLTATDENGKTLTTNYTDANFWRPSTQLDQLSNTTNFNYYTPVPARTEVYLSFGSSIVEGLTTFDGLGRVSVSQRQQGPGLSSFDAVETDFDSLGRPSRTTVPYASTSYGQTNSSAPATTQTYDPLNRPHVTTDGGGGTVTNSYSNNDVLVTTGPAPSGEITKQRQLEYDALGRLTSVCELTSLSGSGICGQNASQTGYWTKYTYDTLGNLLTVTQNAQALSGSQQTRNYSYDFLSRLTSETNPESGTTNYSYDVIPSGCANSGTSSAGDMTKKSDAAGHVVCPFYDALHRATDVGSDTGCKRFRYDNTNGVLGTIPSGVSVSNKLGRLVEAETDTCASPITQSSIITDEWFSYTSRGEISDEYESTPHSGGYYHTSSTYWPNGAVNSISGPAGYAMSWNVDGEGRLYSTYNQSGILSGTLYNAAGQATQINFGTGDSDSYTYDPNTGRMTQYKFTVGSSPQSVIGNLTWNYNGTLSQLAITDPFNSANAQTCNYAHDDLVRIASANCGSAAAQTFSYDPFGNINIPSGGSPYSFAASYSNATNRITCIGGTGQNCSGGTIPNYDANGNVLNDSLHSYTWDADGNSVTLDGVGLTFDAFDRMVEQNRSGAYTQLAYSTTGFKIAILNGQSYTTAFVPMSGGVMGVWGTNGILLRHPDWLGSSRLTSTLNRTVYFDTAYTPFGDPYASTGTSDLNFTGMNADTTSSSNPDYDFLYREYSTQGRWASPDPAGLAAVDPSIPQSWNRYAYVRNNPLALVDPLGLDCVYFLNEDQTYYYVTIGDCSEDDNGYYFDGTINQSLGISTTANGDAVATLNDGNTMCSGECSDGFDSITVNATPLPSGGAVAPFNPLVPAIIAFEGNHSSFFQFMDNSANALACTSGSLLNEIPFSRFLGAQSPDSVGNKVRSAAKAISPNPDAKTLGLIPNNLAVNTQRVVTTLDKLDLPQFSEAAAAAASKFAPYAPYVSKALGAAGLLYMGGNAARNTYTCYQKGGPG